MRFLQSDMPLACSNIQPLEHHDKAALDNPQDVQIFFASHTEYIFCSLTVSQPKSSTPKEQSHCLVTAGMMSSC